MQGMSPCLEVVDQAYTIFPGEGNFHLLEEWTPKNSNNQYSGEKLTLKEGLKKSVEILNRSESSVKKKVESLGLKKKKKKCQQMRVCIFMSVRLVMLF